MRRATNPIVYEILLATILALGFTGAWIVITGVPTLVLGPSLSRLPILFWLIAALLSPLMVGIAILLGALSAFDLSYLSYANPVGFLLLVLLLAFSLVLSIRAYYRHSRVSGKNALTWAIFVFLGGIPGYVGYLAHRRWPVVERCASCGKDTPRDRDDCLYCHAAFPPPSRIGTEIFA